MPESGSEKERKAEREWVHESDYDSVRNRKSLDFYDLLKFM